MTFLINPYRFTPVDPYFSSVSLLLHGNGTNGSTTIIDNSPSPKTVTQFGDAQISTAQSKFGGASIAFDGSGDNLNTSASTDFALGTSAFTVELWAYRLAGAPSNATFLQLSNGTDSWSPIFGFASGSSLQIYISSTGSSWDIANGQSLGTVQVNTWVHYALTRDGSTFRTFENGVVQSAWTSTASIYQVANAVCVGLAQNTVIEFYKGYIDELRITKGVARYTANFTPPSAPFPDS